MQELTIDEIEMVSGGDGVEGCGEGVTGFDSNGNPIFIDPNPTGGPFEPFVGRPGLPRFSDEDGFSG
jgi:hypothetical protein